MDPRIATGAYRTLAAASRAVPPSVAPPLLRAAASAAMLVTPERRLLAERNMSRAHGRLLSPAEASRGARAAFEAYARYWVESFRLPGLDAATIDAGMSWSGYERLRRHATDGGPGPIIVLPHLGGWEWAGFWLTLVEGLSVTVVVEPLEPPELLDFFTDFRERLGMHIVPLGPDAGHEVLRAIKRGDVVCLLSDRDIDGTGVEVELFGERTTMPAGPATLALRTGAPLLPTGCYFSGTGHFCEVRAPVPAERRGRLREDVARVSQDLAHELEVLVRAAPEQWHLMQPNWPSDHEALGGA